MGLARSSSPSTVDDTAYIPERGDVCRTERLAFLSPRRSLQYSDIPCSFAVEPLVRARRGVGNFVGLIPSQLLRFGVIQFRVSDGGSFVSQARRLFIVWLPLKTLAATAVPFLYLFCTISVPLYLSFCCCLALGKSPIGSPMWFVTRLASMASCSLGPL